MYFLQVALNPYFGYFKYPILDMIYLLKTDIHFLYNEALDLPLSEFKWFFNKALQNREEKPN